MNRSKILTPTAALVVRSSSAGKKPLSTKPNNTWNQMDSLREVVRQLSKECNGEVVTNAFHIRRKLLRERFSLKDDWWSNCSKATECNVKLKSTRQCKHSGFVFSWLSERTLMQRKSTNGDTVYLTT